MAAAWYSVQHELMFDSPTPLFFAGSLAAFSLPLWLADRLGRKSKKMFDWNWIDAAIVGVVQIVSLVPGSGRQATALTAALFRNYSREAAVKFLFFSLLPLLVAQLIFSIRGVDFHAPAPAEGMSWLTYAVAVVVTFFSGMLAIGGFVKSIRTRGFGGFVTYRLILAAGIVILVLIQNYS
jgi:undecaprenyl-diphosphatase